MKHGLTYLAAPYSHSDPDVIEQRMATVGAIQGRLVMLGWTVVTPLSCHFILQYAPELGTDWAAWKEYSETLMSKCDTLVILNLAGWRESIGVKGEIELARERGIACLVYDIDDHFFLPLKEYEL